MYGMMCAYFLLCLQTTAQAQSVEMKLNLRLDVCNDRQAVYTEIWSKLQSIAEEQAIGAETATEFGKEDIKRIVYFDTQHKDLLNHQYILRQRIKFKKNAYKDTGDLMLKHRVNHGESLDFSIVNPAEAYKEKIKNEIDCVGYVDGVVGQYSCKESLSTTLKAVPVMQSMTMQELTAYFPNIVQLGPAPETVLTITQSALAYETTLGKLNWTDEVDSDINLVIWYDVNTSKPLVVELSWKYNDDNAVGAKKVQDFSLAVQNEMKDLLVAGQMKSES